MNAYAVTRAVKTAPADATIDLALISGETLTGKATAPDDHALRVEVGSKVWTVPATCVVAVGLPK